MEPFQMNVLTLAYIGDAVYEVFVRRALVGDGNQPAGRLHRLAMKYVSAARQSLACVILVPRLTEDELSVYMRARNASPTHVPRNSEVADYHKATALEAVFGYLDLKKDYKRSEELFGIIFDYLSSDLPQDK